MSPVDAWFAPAPDPARVAWLKDWAYAHRGLHGGPVVENSAGAFRAAIAAGMGIECDIQRSRDDWPMVFHDWDLDRLLGRADEGESLSADEWRTLRYASGEAPIALAELLEIVAGRVPILIEIKSRRGYDVAWSCRRVVDALAGYSGRHAVMSFDPRVSHWLRAHSPATVRGLVMTEEGAKGLGGKVLRHHYLWYARPDFLAYDVRDLPSRFAAAQRRRGMPVLTWTVRSPELLARARECADAPIWEGQGVAESPPLA